MLQTDEPVRDARFDDAFRDLAPRVTNLVQRVVADRSDAEDVVQEAFLRLAGQPVLGRPPGEVSAWVHRVALNLAFNRVRDTRRWRDRTERGGRLDAAGATVGEPLEEVLRTEEQARVRASLAQLPPKQRDCLLLRHSGYAYAEIADVLDMPSGSVGTTLARAERAFRTIHEDATGEQ